MRPLSGTVTFTGRARPTKTVNVTVNGDTLDELNETFLVNLSSPSNATSLTAGHGTITDDDPTPSISINDVTVTEGNTGTTVRASTLRFRAASRLTVNVNYRFGRRHGHGRLRLCGHLGDRHLQPRPDLEEVNVTVNGDTLDELNETFSS